MTSAGRSKRKLVEWLIVEVARNAGEDYIIRPPMDAMKVSDDERVRAFWLAVVWNGQHNEGPFRIAMAGATGITNIMIESLPFLSDFVRDQSQEVLEQLTNSLLIYCKKQDKLPEEPRPTITLDDLIKAIPARFGEGWKATAESMEGTFKPFLDKFKIHLPGMPGKKDSGKYLAMLDTAVNAGELTEDQAQAWMAYHAKFPHENEPALHRIQDQLNPTIIKALLAMPDDKTRTAAILTLAPDTFGEEFDEVITGGADAVSGVFDGFEGFLDRRQQERETRLRAAGLLPPSPPPTTDTPTDTGYGGVI